MHEFYVELKSLIDELEMHQPVVTDATTSGGYRQDVVVSVWPKSLTMITSAGSVTGRR